MGFSEWDEKMMRRALSLAKQGQFSARPNPAVGCVITQQDRVIAEGWHQKAGEPHAERVALASASEPVKGATIYVTLEPCSHFGRTPPCADALIDASVARVVVAMQDPNPQVAGSGIQRLRDAGIQVDVGLLVFEAEVLNKGFNFAMRHLRPLVQLKMASSLDGRTAMASGESQWITGAASRQKVQWLRAEQDAMLTGIGTVLHDDPSLTVRLDQTSMDVQQLHRDAAFQPIRVVLDPRLKLPLTAKLIDLPGQVVVMAAESTLTSQPQKLEQLQQKGVAVHGVVEQQTGQLDLKAVLTLLWQTYQVQRLMVEAGARLAGALIQAKLVDEFHLFSAPVLLGDAARPLCFLPGLDKMADKIQWDLQSVEMLGADIYLQLTPKK
ncbi:bifunctional diaminohydroxyphosphoribosylaminopyrimidine deaminase/5-amino-6-(5-phosphoribosylamino)uracil reductase RibD [Hydrogenovibrio sp. SC-1]|uniref:bifunctional diaminohydroxyphosphoribosylaminopyrimidine deaminase/5-amino-6-(5-phosphoribosylamino)uracil reductase RibD n=1 Tax=Hydrogenovibrio sp. SC-1 TaxID=2065820 RepID=UPI000C7E5428|nr:bifunctional diaminohydroxyphosphoribosylaminopyrimidine deaminase/5-amino-6-(5-phosphoribosylamino)uracil reductase RibD [Hydrogenovibrio sp. SC-1]PLA74303.1 bifunctional diaminohydroxyphosphoribosylaminopyrimidine deaminase/5-amino-6-(5-phosphoribosylamino)uracil reductase RibD [Hydrogenovibrio sp. SC-1]